MKNIFVWVGVRTFFETNFFRAKKGSKMETPTIFGGGTPPKWPKTGVGAPLDKTPCSYAGGSWLFPPSLGGGGPPPRGGGSKMTKKWQFWTSRINRFFACKKCKNVFVKNKFFQLSYKFFIMVWKKFLTLGLTNQRCKKSFFGKRGKFESVIASLRTNWI